MNKNYENMSNKEIKEQLEWSDHHEFSYNYAIWAFEEIDRLNNIIKELSKDVDMWNKKYNEQFNIINELEKWLEDNLGNCRTNQNYTSNQIYNLKEDIYYRCLNKLKALKENNKDAC